MKRQNIRVPIVLKTVYLSIAFLLMTIFQPLKAQVAFGDKCIGNWEGTMYIYGKGQLRDSVPVQLTVQKTANHDTWKWKTSYLSKTQPMVKDYKLILKDATTNTYVTDEGDGIILKDYLFNNKLYNVFETQGIFLTSSYELIGEQLIFEVSTGKKLEEENKGVTNYSVTSLQRVIFKKSTSQSNQ
jgi:hypothetical protein